MTQKEQNKHQIIEGALAGGVIGASLGALLTGKSKDTVVAALVGAAIGASIKALEEAESLSTPVMFEENGKLYKRYANGKTEFVRELPRHNQKIPSTFIIGKP